MNRTKLLLITTTIVLAVSAVSPVWGADSGEFLIDTAAVYTSAQDEQSDPAVAFDGRDYLVAWRDSRMGESAVFAARVSQSRALLDTGNILIAAGNVGDAPPAVAFCGTVYLVVWDGPDSSRDAAIWGARISTSGELLDTASILISVADHDRIRPRVASDGLNFLVVWQDNRFEWPLHYDIWGARVSMSGTVLDTAGVVVTPGEPAGESPAIANDGTNYLAVWNDDGEVRGSRVNGSGAVLDPNGIDIWTDGDCIGIPDVCYGDVNYFVAWQDEQEDMDIYGARVSVSGSVLDPEGIVVSEALTDQVEPAAVFDGANFLTAWGDERCDTLQDIYGARVGQSGVVLDPAGLPLATSVVVQATPALSSNGHGSFLVWEEGTSWQSDIRGARVTQTGVADTNGTLVSMAASNQGYPAIDFDGLNYLVVWRDNRGEDESADVYGMRVSASGIPLDPPGITVCTADSSQRFPALAFGGVNYLVVWHDYRSIPVRIYGARVAPDGTVLDPGGIAISPCDSTKNYHPAVVHDGTNYLVVWDGQDQGSWDIIGGRVSGNGVVLDSNGILIATDNRDQRYPALAVGDWNSLVVWQERVRTYAYYDIYGARVLPDGTVADTVALAIAQGEDDQDRPDLAFDGTNYLVVWEDDEYSPRSIRGVKVSQSGIRLGGPIDICLPGRAVRRPAVVFGATEHVVVSDGGGKIYAATVSPSGSVSGPYEVTEWTTDQDYPALAAGPGGQLLVVYSGWAGEVQGRVYNANRIWGKLWSVPGVQEDNIVPPTGTFPATVVCNVLFLPHSSFGTRHSTSSLLDVTGRHVADLTPGPNDVRHLAPGVYFVCGKGTRGQGAEGSSAKVVIQR